MPSIRIRFSKYLSLYHILLSHLAYLTHHLLINTTAFQWAPRSLSQNVAGSVANESEKVGWLSVAECESRVGNSFNTYPR